jgi:hypothetical protein
VIFVQVGFLECYTGWSVFVDDSFEMGKSRIYSAAVPLYSREFV